MDNVLIWIISFVAIAGVIIRPFKISEAIYAIGGAALLLLFRLINPSEAFFAVAKGLDVYLFLTGMMLLAETAREEKLFDWLAAHATVRARGSSGKLFLLVYLVGVVVTTFLSNDATAIVLTPAVAAAVGAAKVEKPLPYLFICAFVANAASFVLPISNPANLVIYGKHMPSLLHWLSLYFIPSLCAMTVTYFMLRFSQRGCLKQKIITEVNIPDLSAGGKAALIGIGGTAAVLLAASAWNIALGLPTLIMGITTSGIVLAKARKNPVIVIKGIAWAVLPLVAGLFVVVEALNKTGMTQVVGTLLSDAIVRSEREAVWLSGSIVALACNLMNNLPAGLIVGNVLHITNTPNAVKSAVLIGVDLGPNLSITGSLATILWLVALRREGQEVSAWTFLKLGTLIMTTALIACLILL